LDHWLNLPISGSRNISQFDFGVRKLFAVPHPTVLLHECAPLANIVLRTRQKDQPTPRAVFRPAIVSVPQPRSSLTWAQTL